MEKKESMRKFILSLCIIIFDQLSKNWVERNILFGDYLEINKIRNILNKKKSITKINNKIKQFVPKV